MFYFNNKEKREQLYTELEGWLNTPHKHRCQVKGKGVDCIHLLIGCFEAIGIFKSHPFVPEYACDWHLHNTRELLIDEIKKNLSYIELSKGSDFLDGDILIYKFGKAGAHVSLYSKGRVYHSVTGLRVTKSSVNEGNWKSKMIYHLRLLEDN